ncbi:substrate-binding periplasmic protein [Nitratidesulfovibrio sp. SRB-5]|uniref:substrate-binding periplasmic protein n=1 Tax=Nitratidesulfovibrio sp. SRB-5 TaxID=2872636 RepID=UPI00102711D4|nr:transporter substrate-binding domain-containing protein [Nitratidesulfovibrio sp. SRB-5]MBZ2171566.1 transporter substrate-binding domain-containing protein [Nitratidesulfovibrio sp. SRB-5]RXF76177.1 transporter substrate-binding domain-containing protein [Desulfovibrio sp. DS-1]
MAPHRVRPHARPRSFCACLRPLGILLLVLGASAAPLRPVLATTSAPEPREITVYVYHRPPFFTATPESQGGALVEMSQIALERAGLKPRLVTSTFTEILATFRAGAPFACTPGVYRTPERETFARFVGPLYGPLPPVIVVRRTDAGLAASARSLDSLLAGGLRVVLGDGYWYGTWLAQALERTGTSPTRTRDENTLMLRSIVDGTHDISFMSHEEAAHLLRTHPDLGTNLTLRPVPGNPTGESRYLMLAKGVDAATAARIDTALRELAETPRYRELVRSLRHE